MTDVAQSPDYLQPYLDAVRRHGAEFPSLLWASPRTQAARFDAITRACDPSGLSVLDVGCGRADLLDYLWTHDMRPDHYVGLEAVETLADAAEARRRTGSMIVRADFVAEPARMFVAADVVVFCGSLNTLPRDTFYQTLHTAYEATASDLVFNFLCSNELSGAHYLHWHRIGDVREFLADLSGDVQVINDYLAGDCTIRVRKHEESGKHS